MAARRVHKAAKTARNGRTDLPEARARWRRTSHMRRYGLTQEGFDALLASQGYACAMCAEPFTEDTVICMDHDHACCPDERRSCGKCLRGLLCRPCNAALGHIERRGELARAYLARYALITA